MLYCYAILLGAIVSVIKCQQRDIVDYFANCRKNSSQFDSCVKDGLNDMRELFTIGVPKYGIKPFDPFYASEVPQKMSGPGFNYKLILKNVTESGWEISQVTRFKSDFNRNQIQYTQSFPDKQLKGDYDFSGQFLGMRINNKGSWSLGLYDFVQTTTVTRKPRQAPNGTLIYDTPLKVSVNVQSSKDLTLHISNLLGGRRVAENMLDAVINTAWQPGFVVLRPLINDLVSTAFTKIFNDAFQGFPFDNVIR